MRGPATRGAMSAAPARRPAAPSVAPARRCAYTVLRRVFEHGAYADRALQAEARDLDARDRALAMRLAYGAVQRKGTLDNLIERLAQRPVRRLDAPVLAALRLGLYELLYLGGAPDRAVVADAVELAKRQHGGRNGRAGAGHGLVNAVLRRATREGLALLNALDDDTSAHAAVKHSHPEWIARLWWEHLGAQEARALLARDNEPGELALRANTLLTDAPSLARELAGSAGGDAQTAAPGGDGARRIGEAHLDPDIPEAVVIPPGTRYDIHGSPLWRAGMFVAQSRAAMLPSRMLAPQPGERVLDLCAAPGGKTTHLAALMRGEGEVVAVERNPRRAAALASAVQRLRARNVRVEVRDAALPWPEGEAFDRVLVDPPCSGLGTLQARADLRWRVTPRHVEELARQQAEILAAGAAALRPGGVLVYSTCTISPLENELQVAAFLDSHPDFGLDDLAAELPRLANPGASAERTVLTLPHRDHTAGFFIARLRRS
jgi:16S rRNA (cytosine967-C5)-methyltransferase